jgi:hypothetical protein
MTDAGSEEKVICASPDETCHERFFHLVRERQPYTPLALKGGITGHSITGLSGRTHYNRRPRDHSTPTALRHADASASGGLSTGTMERDGAALIWRSLASASIQKLKSYCTVMSVCSVASISALLRVWQGKVC